MLSQNGKVLRTYKTGLKLPASLLEPFTQLVREREILQFLRKYPDNFSKKQAQKLHETAADCRTPTEQKWECFRWHKNLHQAAEAIQGEYRTLFENYQVKSPQAIEDLLQANQRQIAFFTRTDLQYDSKLTLQRRISHPAKPQPTEISLHDYQLLARQSLKQLCGLSRTYAVENIQQLPLDTPLTERQVTTLLGNKANHLHSVSTQMAMMMNVGNTIRQKVRDVKELLRPASVNEGDFREMLPIYLAFYSVPTHFRNYLAKRWQVDPQWVRNTLVGWRRKIDPRLPPKMQIEPLTAFMEDLATYCVQFCREDQERKVIGILQRKHALHLLPTPLPLEALVPSKYRPQLAGLRQRIAFPPELREKIAAATSDIDLALFTQHTETLSLKIREHLATLEPASPGAKRTQTFLNKLALLQTHIAAFPDLLCNYLPGNRYTGSAAQIILYTLNQESLNTNRVRRLFTALRGVIAPAFAQFYPEATAQFGAQFTPDHCVSRPFTTIRKAKQYLPLELKSPKYVIPRKRHPNEKTCINNEEATTLFATNQPLWLGFKIYTPEQFQPDGSLSSQTKGTLWFRLFPTKKIRECIQRGAIVKAIRLNNPQGPTNKIIADIILEANSRAPFRHATRFLHHWKEFFPKMTIPKACYLGSDLNQLGRDMLALGTDQCELDIAPLMADFERDARKLTLFRKKIIPHLQSNLTRKNDGKTGRRKTELTNIHHKRQQITTEANRRLLMVYLYVIWQTRAQHVAWDCIEGLNSQGKKGEFAVAVQSLPNNQEQFALFRDWLEDLQHLQFLSPETQIHPVSPFTSAVCPQCYAQTGKRKRSRAKATAYHDFKCRICGYSGNRHSTAAMVEAIDMKIAMEGLPSC
jgi:predicted RNA-binding Zn-ribbon protein involved in translation (DUF1610 family)